MKKTAIFGLIVIAICVWAAISYAPRCHGHTGAAIGDVIKIAGC